MNFLNIIILDAYNSVNSSNTIKTRQDNTDNALTFKFE